MFTIINCVLFLLTSLVQFKSTLSSIKSIGYVYPAPTSTLQPLKLTNVPITSNGIESTIAKEAALQYAFNLNHFNVPSSFAYNNLLTDSDTDTYFADDGRILKQYEVMEHIPGDHIPNDLLNRAPLLLSSLLAKYSRISPSLLSSQQLQLQQQQQQTSRPQIIFQPVTRNHGPVALGSGALGYIQLPNGGIYLGSGSLGYISGSERIREINDARMRRIIQPSPLVFGTTHLN